MSCSSSEWGGERSEKLEIRITCWRWFYYWFLRLIHFALLFIHEWFQIICWRWFCYWFLRLIHFAILFHSWEWFQTHVWQETSIALSFFLAVSCMVAIQLLQSVRSRHNVLLGLISHRLQHKTINSLHISSHVSAISFIKATYHQCYWLGHWASATQCCQFSLCQSWFIQKRHAPPATQAVLFSTQTIHMQFYFLGTMILLSSK